MITPITIDYGYDPLYRLTSASYSSGETYGYSYDAVGNRLTMDSPQGSTTYTYDAANRLTSAGGQTYTWDNKGNLTSDGVRGYTYDHANRLKQVTEGSLTTQFAYNGDGVRTRKTVDGTTTDYVVDLATTLPVVISDTDAVYLYGLDIIAEQLAQSDRYYYMHDGLGSVRQLLDNTGQIAETYAYDPFGVPLAGDTVPNPWQFTGEAWDAEVELLYLRARYYQPETGRFITKDPWPGDVLRPGTLNGFVYVTNNAVNYTDPSGLQGPDTLGLRGLERPTRPAPAPVPVPPGYPNDFVDHRDLTIWLVEELRTNASSPNVMAIQTLLNSASPELKLAGTSMWVSLVANDHTWDFKDQVLSRLDSRGIIMLRHFGEHYGWYEYSVPGNIHYGYVGRAAGWSAKSLHFGASLAEIFDPAHRERGEAACFIWVYPTIPGCPRCILRGYLNPEWKETGFDDPDDWNSVEFGIRLYERHPVSLTLDQFRLFLFVHGHMLRLYPEPLDAGEYRQRQNQWPYWHGYFNGWRIDPLPN